MPWLFHYSKNLHRFVGKAYAYSILLFAGTSGFVLALHANGGTVAKAGFVAQCICWMITTFMAVNFAVQKNWLWHIRCMMLSYAITLGAFSLRIANTSIQYYWVCNADNLYRVLAWASWLGNVAICILLIYNKKDQKIIQSFFKQSK